MLDVSVFRSWLTNSHDYSGGFKGIDEDGTIYISATDLNRGPQEFRLLMEHKHELASPTNADTFRANIGTVLHSSFEQYFKEALPMAVQEERRTKELVLGDHKIRITGQVDMIHEGQLYDLKTRSCYGFNKKHSFGLQGAVYKHLLFPDLITAPDEVLVNLWHDYKPSEDGPNNPITLEIVPLMNREELLAYITSWVEELLDPASTCTREQRWMGEDRYALMKPGGKRALKVFDTQGEAVAAQISKPGYIIEVRHGEPRKCMGYCPVSAFCPQYTGVSGDDGTVAYSPQRL